MLPSAGLVRGVCVMFLSGTRRKVGTWRRSLHFAVHCHSFSKMATMLSRTISLVENLSRFNGSKVRDCILHMVQYYSFAYAYIGATSFLGFSKNHCYLRQWIVSGVITILDVCSLLNWAPGSGDSKPKIVALHETYYFSRNLSMTVVQYVCGHFHDQPLIRWSLTLAGSFVFNE